jgi:glycosyltransferase involved in cell wall biosynthesis
VRVLILGPAEVVHTQRWVEALDARGMDLTLVTQHPPRGWKPPAGVTMRVLPFRGSAGYFANTWALRRIAHEVRPDLVNAHYASGYGTTAALVNYRPTLLSVWGSDVFDFPYESWLKGRLVRWNLQRAARVASTSHVMAAQVRRLSPEIGEIAVTPFGVDTRRFYPDPERRDTRVFTIGTVKTLAPKYGIDVLVRAFARLAHDPDLRAVDAARPLRLLLVGDGPQKGALEQLASQLRVADRTRFAGKAAHSEVPGWLNRLDVYVAPSRLDSESFGVAVLEASSCGVPVIVSDAGGLPEVVRAEESGIVFRRDDEPLLVAALKRLVLDEALRLRFGMAGRAVVQREYEWARCVDAMLACYRTVASAVPASRTATTV